MHKKVYFLTAVVAVASFYLVGCEFGKFPLILDSSVTSSIVHVNLTTPLPTQLTDSVSVNISDLKEATSENVDSIKFYNLTLLVENNTSTPLNAQITGLLSINGDSLLSLANVPLSEFSKERSIFDKTITGYKYHIAGIAFLLHTLKTQLPPIINIKTTVGSSASALHFDLKVKVYGQLYTKTK